MHPGELERLVMSLKQACSGWELSGLLEGKEQIMVETRLWLLAAEEHREV